MIDFFISYTQADTEWAEWIALVLEEAGYTTTIQAWDFRPGDNFVVKIQEAATASKRTIAVLSPDYLRSMYAKAEWAAALAADPTGANGKLVPVLVREVDQEDMGLLSQIVYIKMVDLSEAAARKALVKGLTPGRNRPESVRFPGAVTAPSDLEVALSTLKTLPLEEVPKPGPLPVGSRMPLAPNPLFVDREKDLKVLARQLKAGATSAIGQGRSVVATGFGGIGKTQLASEFVHRYGRFFAGGVFWMSFADADSVSVEIAACGQSLGLHESFDALTLEQQVRLVEEAWQSPLPRLLVFDGCEEEELLYRWRPRFGGCRVLVTSRRAVWDAALGVIAVPITTLVRPSSIELLRLFRPDVAAEDPVFDAIAEELGDLPLALHLAGSFLKTYRSSPSGEMEAYLKQLRKADLLAHPSLQGRGTGISPTGHEADVGRTSVLSFERLDPATDALAIDLLSRAAWFAPGEPIPRSLLLRSAHVDLGDLSAVLEAGDALRQLTDLGLLEVLEVKEQKDPLMDRLVAAWARGLEGSDLVRATVEEVIVAEASRLNETGNQALLQAWQPHLQQVTDGASNRRDEMAARLCNEMGVLLWWAGDYLGARLYLEKAVSLHEEVSGKEHPATASSLNNLGRLFQSQGQFTSAQAAYKRGLAVREKILGPEHPDTAKSLVTLGTLHRDQGNFARARWYWERAARILNAGLGPKHPDTKDVRWRLSLLPGSRQIKKPRPRKKP